MNPMVIIYLKLNDLKSLFMGRAIIEDVPTELFNKILGECIDSGWKKVFVYEGFDAWIDYGRADLKNKGRLLRFEWDNWTEGEISGPLAVVNELAGRYTLFASRTRKLMPSVRPDEK